MKTIVIESYENEIHEWGISFTNSNPEARDYFPMPDKETAYRLQKYLAEAAPIAGNKPICSPGNEFAWVES